MTNMKKCSLCGRIKSDVERFVQDGMCKDCQKISKGSKKDKRKAELTNRKMVEDLLI